MRFASFLSKNEVDKVSEAPPVEPPPVEPAVVVETVKARL